jgi:dTDP-4-dehydrorhamnose reductase
MRILVLGANGMIGSTMLRVLAEQTNWYVVGSLRSSILPASNSSSAYFVGGIDLSNSDHLVKVFQSVKPEVVVNCAGLTKHLPDGNDPIPALTMNALLPHRLATLCDVAGARLIQVSTDCVFSGRTGNYSEDDQADATDVYGKTKHLGEVLHGKHVTLRTSTIGHETHTQFGLLEWFLAQKRCKGFSKAIFSGLPTPEFARVVRDYVIPNPSLQGLYHVGAEAINKDRLLRLIAQIYERDIEIEADDVFTIDRSLNSTSFTTATGYKAATWSELIKTMRQYK